MSTRKAKKRPTAARTASNGQSERLVARLPPCRAAVANDLSCRLKQHENRDHLLSNVRRLGRGRHGAGHRARGARARSSFHQLRHADSPERRERAHLLPRSGSHHLPAFRSSALHAGAGHEDGRSGRRGVARSAARALRHSAFGERAAGAHDGRAPAASLHHHAARHRYHAGRQRPQLSADHSLFHRAERRRHGHFELPARPHRQGIRNQAADRSDPEFRQLRSVQALGRCRRSRALGARTASRS